MAAKQEISWKRRDPDGERWEVNARYFGREWAFYQRRRRYDQWALLKEPSLDDWMELLDGVERRVKRRLLPPETAPALRRRIKDLHPEADLD